MKKVMYALIGLVVLYLILCLVGPSSVTVKRSISINSRKEKIMSEFSNLESFDKHWSPWKAKDPNMKTNMSGTMGEPGSSMSWESELRELGKGSMTFDKISGDSVLQSLHIENFGDAQVFLIVNQEKDSCKVTWGMFKKFGFFGRGFMLFMNMDKMAGADYEKGLANLKTYMESLPKETADQNYDIKEINWDAQTYIGKRGTFKFMELAKFFGETYPKLGEYFAKNNLKMYSAPSAIYFKFDEVNMETECAAVFLLKDKIKVKDWEIFEIPASKVLMIEYYGAYDKSAKAHYAMDAYMKGKGMNQNFVIEEYVTDPISEKDTAKWLTNIYYVLK